MDTETHPDNESAWRDNSADAHVQSRDTTYVAPCVAAHSAEGRTVGALAAMSGVSVRTLHYYDQIGLLSPGCRSASGYRLYGSPELGRLQQILLYRELDLPLDSIRKILDSSGFDTVRALEGHQTILEAHRNRLDRLILTVKRSIAKEKGDIMVTDEELYEGFSDEKIASMKKEAKERWGSTDAYRESARRVERMTKDDFAAVKASGETLEREFAELSRSGARPDGAEGQSLAGRWANHLRAFYDPTAEMLSGLGQLYVESPEFRARYEAMAVGLPEFFRGALTAYAARM